MKQLLERPDEDGKPLITFPAEYSDILETVEAEGVF
jgi:hypothetical protein